MDATNSESDQRWVKQPRQRRSRERLEAIYAAAEKLFLERGFRRTTTGDIAREAGCGVGSLYDRFDSKDALLRAMHERHIEQTLRTLGALDLAQMAQVHLHAVVVALVQSAQRALVQQRGLQRALASECIANEALMEREQWFRREQARHAVALLLACEEQFAHPDPRTAADYVVRMLMGTMYQRFGGELEPEVRRMSDKRFAEETVRACLGFLGAAH